MHFRYSIYLLFLLLSSCSHLYGQSVDPAAYRADLKQKLASEPDNIQYLIYEIKFEQNATRQSVLCNYLGLEYQKAGKLDSAMIWHKNALAASKSMPNPANEMGVSYNKIGIVHFYQGKYDSAAFYMEQATNHFLDSALKANAFNNLALAYKYIGHPQKSIEQYLSAIDIFIVLKDTAKYIVLLNNVGSLYFEIEEFEKAKEYSERALNMSELSRDEDGIMTSNANLGNIYKDSGNPEKAILFYTGCISYYRKIKDYNNLIANTTNIALAYEDLENHEKAMQYYEQTIDVMDSTGHTRYKSEVFSNTAGLYQKLEMYEKALYYYRLAYQFAIANDQVKPLESLYDNLSTLFKQLNNPDSSLYYRELQVALLDSLEKVERQKKMLELESIHQNKKLEQALKTADSKLEKQNSFFSKRMTQLTVTLILLVSVAFFFVYKNYKKRKESISLKNKIEDKDEQIKDLNYKTAVGKLPYPKHMGELTEREKEVLLQLQEGLKDHEISEKLFISITTVRTHLRKAYSKINVRNRAEAVQFLLTHDISSKPPL
ncbi:MAG: LuxR family transcriptional regulator [Cyclobacteriaceae bacterium]